MEEVILSIIVTIIFAIIQQASSNTVHEKKTFTVPRSPHTSLLPAEDPYELDLSMVEISKEHEMKILDIFQESSMNKRELLVHELREIGAQHDTTTFFEKYPEVHRYIFNMP